MELRTILWIVAGAMLLLIWPQMFFLALIVGGIIYFIGRGQQRR